MPTTIKKQALLLVEGKDEINFFSALLDECQIPEVQIIEVGGKDKFKLEFPALLNLEGFSNVKSYAIIRDADNDANATLSSIQSLLSRHHQPVPNDCGEFADNNGIRVGIYIVPGNKTEGMLENLCLDTVKNNPVLQCVDQYLSCLEENLNSGVVGFDKEQGKHYFPKNRAKARMHAFLAGQNKLVPSLGLAAKKGYFNLRSEVLSELRRFLETLKNA
jgi:hypothetical protein